MIIFLNNGETVAQQRILLKARVRGVVLSYYLIRNITNSEFSNLATNYAKAGVAILITPGTEKMGTDDEVIHQYAKEYTSWAAQCRLANIIFAEPDLPNDFKLYFRQVAREHEINILPIWHAGLDTLEAWDQLCQTYKYVSISGVRKYDDFLNLLTTAARYGTKVHIWPITKPNELVQPHILKRLPFASAVCNNWQEGSQFGYCAVFNGKGIKYYEKSSETVITRALQSGFSAQDTQQGNLEILDTISATAWSQYGNYLDAIGYKYWDGQKRLRGNRHTAKLEKLINTSQPKNTTKHQIPFRDNPELNGYLDEAHRGVGNTFESNQGRISHISKENGLIENKRRRNHEAWIWDKRDDAHIFKQYMQWAGPSGFNQRWLKCIEENGIYKKEEIIKVGRQLFNQELPVATQEQQELVRLSFINGNTQGRDNLEILERLSDQRYFPNKPWLRKSRNRPKYQWR